MREQLKTPGKITFVNPGILIGNMSHMNEAYQPFFFLVQIWTQDKIENPGVNPGMWRVISHTWMSHTNNVFDSKLHEQLKSCHPNMCTIFFRDSKLDTWTIVQKNLSTSHIVFEFGNCFCKSWLQHGVMSPEYVYNFFWWFKIGYLNNLKPLFGKSPRSTLICEWVLSHTWMRQPTSIKESCHAYEWGMPHVNTRGDTKSCHLYVWFFFFKFKIEYMNNLKPLLWQSPWSTLICEWRGGGLGSRPKKMYGKRLGNGVEYHLKSPTPRC